MQPGSAYTAFVTWKVAARMGHGRHGSMAVSGALADLLL